MGWIFSLGRVMFGFSVCSLGVFQFLILLRKICVSSLFVSLSCLCGIFGMFMNGIVFVIIDGMQMRLVLVVFVLESGMLDVLKFIVFVWMCFRFLFELIVLQLSVMFDDVVYFFDQM